MGPGDAAPGPDGPPGAAPSPEGAPDGLAGGADGHAGGAAAGPGAGSKARRRRRLRAACGGLAAVLALGLGELALRARQLARVEARDRDGWHRFDARLGWRPAPAWSGEGTLPAADPAAPPVRFAVRTDALGWRHDATPAPGPAPGTLRIAFVGDSFTFGYGCAVEDGVCARLERALAAPARAAGWTAVEVLNLAVCGFGVDQMRLVVEDDALPLRPHLVLVGVIDQNFRRALRAVSNTGHAKPRYTLAGAGGPDGLRLWGVPVAPPPAPGAWRWKDHPPGGGSFLLWQAGELVERARVALAGGAEGARLRWRLGRALLLDARRVAAARGVPLAVVLHPIRGERASTDPYRPLLAALEPDVPLLDAVPAAEVDDRGALFFDDGHPSPAGAARTAEAVAAALVGRGLLPRPGP